MEGQEEVKECKIKECLCSKTTAIVLACLLCFFIGYYSGYSSAKKTIPNKPRVTAPAKRVPRNIPNFNNKRLPPNVKPPATKPTNVTKPKTATKQNVTANTTKKQTAKATNTTTAKKTK